MGRVELAGGQGNEFDAMVRGTRLKKPSSKW